MRAIKAEPVNMLGFAVIWNVTYALRFVSRLAKAGERQTSMDFSVNGVIFDTKILLTFGDADIAAKRSRWSAYNQTRHPSRCIHPLELIRLVMPWTRRPFGFVDRRVLDLLHGDSLRFDFKKLPQRR